MVDLKSKRLNELKPVGVYVVGITAAIFFIRAFQVVNLEYVLLILVPIFALIHLANHQKPTIEKLSRLVFVIWLFSLLFKTVGFVFGIIGVAVLMLGVTLFLVVRALTSSYYKNSMRALQPRVNKAFKKKKRGE